MLALPYRTEYGWCARGHAARLGGRTVAVGPAAAPSVKSLHRRISCPVEATLRPSLRVRFGFEIGFQEPPTMAIPRPSHDDSLDGLMQRMDQLEALCEMAYHMLSALGMSSRFTELVATAAEGAPLDPIDTETILGEATDDLKRLRAQRDAAATQMAHAVTQPLAIASLQAAVAPAIEPVAAAPAPVPAAPEPSQEDRAAIERLTASLAAEIDRRVQGEIAFTQAQLRAKRVYAYASHWRNRALAAEAHRNTALRVLRDLAGQIDRNVPWLRQAEIFQTTRKVLGELPASQAAALGQPAEPPAAAETKRAEELAAAAQDAGFTVALAPAQAAGAANPGRDDAARPPLSEADLLKLKPVA
jgi:hypothetical protein